jgi:hypothetical protein
MFFILANHLFAITIEENKIHTRFYDSSQAFCESSRIEVGFVGVYRPGNPGKAPRQDDQSGGTG